MTRERISPASYEEVLTCIQVIYACRSLERFPHEILAALRPLIACDLAGYNEVNLKQQRFIFALDPPSPGVERLTEKFPAYMHQHPVIAYSEKIGDGQALKISDFLTPEEFHQLPLYQEVFQHMQVEDQIAITIRVEPGFVIGIAFNRSAPTFTEEDRQKLNLVRPHIVQAYRHAAELAGHVEQKENFQAVLRESGIGVIALNSHGVIDHLTPGSLDSLARYLPVPESEFPRLPNSIVQWLEVTNEEIHVLKQPSSRLTLRRIARENRTLLLLSEEQVADTPPLATQYDLTKREEEVLRWIAEGKTNSEIATILGLTTGTVKVHVEHILAKLHVENRTAAALLAKANQALTEN